MRVVSLVPSVTETLLAWGLTPVACTRFCEQPSLPTVGGTKDPDIAAIVEARPDVVVVNDEENRREDASALAAAGVRVHVTHVERVEDVHPMLADLARAVAVRADLTPIPSVEVRTRRRAFVPIWKRPWMALGPRTYGSSLLAALGIDNVCAEATSRYPQVELADVLAWSPDLVLLPTEPYPFADRHRAALLAAVPGSDVRVIDGQDLFWWGIRTPAAMLRLAAELR